MRVTKSNYKLNILNLREDLIVEKSVTDDPEATKRINIARTVY